ncbi:MAG: efflux RND transporter periplasmic adaptor subunit [Deltaproteobacteria bacterium]|nr:efflux RND transporter periplasmic adaptor subunit [Deltaproteobacteria bacterium]
MKLRSRSSFLAILGCALAGCGRSEPPPPPSPTVTVTRPLVRSVVEWNEFSGHLASPQVVRVTARVSGFVVDTSFQEGSIVSAGDLLYVIDERPFRAELSSREAEVARAEAALAQAELQHQRYLRIKDTKAVSAQDYDQAVALLRQAQAGVAGAKAAREIAELHLQWTRVTASISGRVGRKLVTEGNLVNGGEGTTTELTTITSIDPLFCYVDVPERSYLRYQELALQRDPTARSAAGMPCNIRIGTGGDLPNDCVIDFVDNRLDRGTGTIAIRGLISNTDGALTPGSFARLRIPGSMPYDALLVPDASIGTDQNSRFVLTVNEQNVVESRPVTIGALFGALRAVTKGLLPEERVIMNGMQLARAGASVTPKDGTLDDQQLAKLKPYLSDTLAERPDQPRAAMNLHAPTSLPIGVAH